MTWKWWETLPIWPLDAAIDRTRPRTWSRGLAVVAAMVVAIPWMFVTVVCIFLPMMLLEMLRELFEYDLMIERIWYRHEFREAKIEKDGARRWFVFLYDIGNPDRRYEAKSMTSAQGMARSWCRDGKVPRKAKR